ncbi:Magnesium and cobalt efflux protein CorC [Salmonella enterica subsp. enterica serovar Typhimurium]|nr:Magnesium and cobalt efflux protein CorC [Salmonella enterica subsp. enterica serovar Typhimurium]
MELLMDPSIWVGLLTLVVLEIVLGIDNLVFIAILADKLPPKQRDKARLIGLSLALIMRLALLSIISWLVTLTKPLFTVWDFTFSGRDLIMLLGGIFLLFKATTELHERLENREHDTGHGKGYASFWVVVTQIVILDAVFSLDAVITAVGMVNHLPVMMAAVGDCDGGDATGVKTADPFCQPASDGGGALSEFPADDRLEPGGGRVWFPYSERLPVRGNWFLDRYRGV